MNDDIYLIVLGVGVLIPTLGTLLGWHREAVWSRQIQESTEQIGTCPQCHHDEHPMICMIDRCGCDLMIDLWNDDA